MMVFHPHVSLPNAIIKTLENKNTDEGLKRKFNKALQSFDLRPYPHGLFVKKFKNLGDVWEARLDQSQRLLFNFASRYCQTCRRLVPYVQILDYIPDHDKVNWKARRLNREINDEDFGDWNSSDMKEIGFDLIDIEKTVDCSKEQIQNAVQWFTVDYLKIDRFLLENKSGLRLLLTERQATSLQKSGPRLLLGSAGSGKTILGIYYLLEAITQYPGLKALYVTYNDPLLKESKKLFHSSGSDQLLAQELGQAGVYFSTYRNLCREIAGDKFFEVYQEEIFSQFKDWLGKQQTSKELSPIQIWNEIRSVLRGSVSNLGEPVQENRIPYMLSWDEYRYLGDKEKRIGNKGSFLPSESDRSQIFELAKKYQNHLQKENRYDEMGLTRAALQNVQNNICDVLVVDEIQDLTEIQIDLLLRLVSEKSKNIFLTGDIQQIINPSSFRVANINTLFHNRGWELPEVILMNRNFRCSGPIIRLANDVLEMRKEKIGEYADEVYPEIPVEDGNEKPFVLWENENRVMQELKGFDVQAIDFVVQTEEIRDRLKLELDTKSVWTIDETKGLEFKDVVLWKLTDPNDVPQLSQIKNNNLQESPFSETAHQLNKIYVAVTRARRTLVIFEETSVTYLWRRFSALGSLSKIELANVRKKLNQFQTKQDWQDRGVYLREQEKYEQAAQAFRRADDDVNYVETQGLFLTKNKDYLSAAVLYQEHGNYGEAAKNWQFGENFQNAAICWEKINEFEKAAECWDKIHKYSKAAKNWELANNLQKAASSWENNRSYEKAAINWELSGDQRSAARCWLKLPDCYKAASCYEKIDEFDLAAQNWEKSSEFQKAAVCWTKANKFDRAAECWEADGEYYQAAICLEKAGLPKRAALMWEMAKQYGKAAQIWVNESMLERAAKDWVLAKEYSKGALTWAQTDHFFARAAVCSWLAEDWASAAEFWKKAKYVINAAVCFENAGLLTKAAEMWEVGKRYDDAARLWQHEKNWRKAAKNWVLARNFLAGAEAWAKADHYAKAAVCYQLIKNWSKAADFWAKAKYFRNAAICCDKTGNKNKARKYYLLGNCIREAIERGEIATPEQQAEIYDEDKKFKEAAEVWQTHQKYEKAALSWHNCNEFYKEAYCWEQAAGITKNPEFYSRAEHLYRGLGLKDEARRCEYARLVIDGSDWNKAGQIAWDQDKFEEAKKHFGKIGKNLMIQKCNSKIKNSTPANPKQSILKKQPSKRS